MECLHAPDTRERSVGQSEGATEKVLSSLTLRCLVPAQGQSLLDQMTHYNVLNMAARKAAACYTHLPHVSWPRIRTFKRGAWGPKQKVPYTMKDVPP